MNDIMHYLNNINLCIITDMVYIDNSNLQSNREFQFHAENLIGRKAYEGCSNEHPFEHP